MTEQEVFEKIIKKLEEIKSAIPDLIEYQAADDIESKCDEINDLIREYNNGWIPVEERLPVLYTKILITYMTCEGEKVCEGRYNGTYWYDCDTRTMLNAIAWQPLPEPYQPKGDKE